MKTITANDLKNYLDQDSMLLIDVREPAEHRTESIENSCLIPLAEISVEKLPSRSRPIVIYCRSGKRSSEACKKLLAQDPTLNLYSLEGGIIAWKEAGSNIRRSGSNILPLDLQIQLTAGIIGFSGVILGTFVNQFFYLLPGFVGLGLMFAGLTGWCGMAKLLAKAPWNK